MTPDSEIDKKQGKYLYIFKAYYSTPRIEVYANSDKEAVEKAKKICTRYASVLDTEKISEIKEMKNATA